MGRNMMKIKNRKRIAALTLSCLLFSFDAFAEKAATEEPADITMLVKIVGHERENIYKVTDAEGKELRVDLGKHGGRMLNRHPFTVTGYVVEDENGKLLKMQKVDYKDPVVQIETTSQADAKNSEEKLLPAEAAMNAAYGHKLSKSHNKYYYTYNMADVQDKSLYQIIAVTEIAQQKPGTKIAFVANAVSTVKNDVVMRFWGGAKAGGHIDVVMNGAYVPLGQRSTVYGTLNDDGTVSLELLESVE